MGGNKIKKREENRNFMKLRDLCVMATLTEFLQISSINRK